MPYATASELEHHLGSDRYIDLADRDRDGAADAAAVASALTKASSLADSYCSHLLPIPTPYPEALVDAVLAIATYRLAGNAATEDERQQYDDAVAWLRDVSRGRARLSTAEDEVSTAGDEVMVDVDERQWSRDQAGKIF